MSFAVESLLMLRQGEESLRDAVDLREARVLEVDGADLKAIMDMTMGFVDAVGDFDMVWEPVLPFPVTWISTKVRSDRHVKWHNNGIQSSDVLLGFWATSTDAGCAMLDYATDVLRPGAFVTAGRVKDTWVARRLALTILAICASCDAAYSTVVERHVAKATRGSLAAFYRPKAPVPKAYRRVQVRDRVRMHADARSSYGHIARSFVLNHRHDVRGHWKCLVRYGPLAELSVEAENQLRMRGYKVSRGGSSANASRTDFDDHTDELLRVRGIWRRDDEYLAVLVLRIDAYERGPAEGPYVPSCWHINIRKPLDAKENAGQELDQPVPCVGVTP